MKQPLMPMATAVWLVDNTSLSFRQIAEFCSLHELEVQGIADEQVAQNIVGLDPIVNGQLSWDDIKRCQDDPSARLELLEEEIPAKTRSGGARYTPVSKRQDKPDAIAWLLKFHPELSNAQICRLVGTTKPTIMAIRERSHWNMSEIKPVDPVLLGLCKQTELDEAVKKAAPPVVEEPAVEEPEAVVAEDVSEDAAPADAVSEDQV
ncbi:cell cycle transcriptional regulator TrcR [Paremcibacter congregatus]|uniref:cell cycle transcriptional regulator TrcR n=1 Tax=Paremcibacter congregatus TaxID=2043170 RepID=UPI0030EC6738|tara:strand:- start:3759 stop:4376 length:618 start_codon:yes stop_codon:yes gene_type:complete